MESLEGRARGGKITAKLLLWFLAGAVAVMIGTTAIVVIDLKAFAQLTHRRAEQFQLIGHIQELLSLAKDTETACRGFLLTGKQDYLEPYHVAAPKISALGERLAEDARRGLFAEQAWEEIQSLLDQRFEICEESVTQYTIAPEDRAQQLALSDHGKQVMDSLRASVSRLVNDEMRELEHLDLAVRAKEVNTIEVILLGFGLSGAIFIGTAIFLLVQTRRRARAEAKTETAYRRLHAAAEELRARNALISRLGEMSHTLQSAVTFAEALQVMSETMPTVFDGTRGALFLTRESRDHLETGASWGEGFEVPPMIGPMDCWALRKGQVHHTVPGDKALRCPHVAHDPAGASLCVPLQAQGDARGVIYLEFPGQKQVAPEEERNAGACAQQVIVALANLQLRDRLRTQATRDPLSGLFNRRYVMETAERELFRAARNGGAPVAFLLIDIDHFKRFNDTYGHDAGDHVLKALAEHLRKFVRGSDIAARYGGEEFLLVLPDAPKAAGAARARVLGEQVRAEMQTFRDISLGAITLSIGVAAFPEDGTHLDDLLKVADVALYQAKANGRDQVVVGNAPAVTGT